MPEFKVIGLDPNFVSYKDGLELQRDLHRKVVAGDAPDTVLLLEHSSVYTAGKRTEDHELPKDGSEYFETDRGGKITWHGPGQLIGYPIMRLPQPIDVVNYVRYLEEVLIDVIAEFGVAGIRVKGRTGVWVETPLGTQKVAAIGIRVSEKVTMHGFALNCNNSLDPYDHIIACGIQDATTTTLSILTGKLITPADAASLVMQKMGEIPNERKARA
ncbi:lipoyl(octanoyl) transferase LipB [Aquiluna sp. KACHI24]|uniref:lipoyl(octanoyl) transferase LipB n=1 Tax=Aquiluna sp. KACHI24 TaxID=2968831 RepID=UPI0021F94494|nr:lipoyl(octanoyl) transferase LipB [Aquiluna sp. KACHI24]BDQ00361.1 octanoyltransferase [Aquiluna sp. KACHI24]